MKFGTDNSESNLEHCRLSSKHNASWVILVKRNISEAKAMFHILTQCHISHTERRVFLHNV